MTQDDLFEQFQERRRIAREGIPRVPPASDLAPIVRFTRASRGWKQQTLADFARVSVSTVERIERGISVNPENLDRVGVALGYQKGDFTEPRVPASDEEMVARLSEWKRLFDENKIVAVRPLRTQSQVRALLKADGYWIDMSRLRDDVADLEAGLQETLDCYSFVINSEGWLQGPEPIRRREIYQSVLTLVRGLEGNGATALAGTYKASTPAGIWTVALVAFFPRDSDPAAAKRRAVMAPKYLNVAVPDWMRKPPTRRATRQA